MLHLNETAISTRRRVDGNGDVVTDAPPALHLTRDHHRYLEDSLYTDGNFHPSLSTDNVNAEPFRSISHGRRYGHGITWTEWVGSPPRRHHPIQAQIALLDDTTLADLLRAGHAAGFDMFTIDADLRPGVPRRAR